MPASNLTRRTFVVGGAAFLAGVVAGAGVRPFVVEADVLRPPGALPEGEFMARCIKCARCIDVCPTDVLEPLGIERGLLQARTPHLNFANDRCTFCDKCREVCPTAAIGAVDPQAPGQGRIGAAILHEDRCLAFLETSSCGICVEACPYGALSFDAGRRPVVDEAKCNGCGECVRICPANVFTSFSGGKARGIEVVTERALQEGGAAR